MPMNVLVATPSQRAAFYINLLSDKNPGVLCFREHKLIAPENHKKAAEALGAIGDKGSLVGLKAQLEQETDDTVRQAIETAIELLSADSN